MENSIKEVLKRDKKADNMMIVAMTIGVVGVAGMLFALKIYLTP